MKPVLGIWIPISEYNTIYWPEVQCLKVLFYHPKYRNEKGQEFIADIQIINWPEVPNTHFYIVPGMPNSSISGKPESPQSDGGQSIPPKLLPRTVLDLRVELIVANEDIERLRAQLNEAHFKSRIASATHRCKVCDARWIKFEGNWSMASKQCGKCCDVVAMGDQIEPIGLTAEIEEYAALTEKLSGLLRDIANVLRGHPGELSFWGFTGLAELGAEILDERDLLKSDIAASKDEVERLRAALISALSNTDATVGPECSTDFLCTGADEIRSYIERLRAALDAATAGRASSAEGYRDVISATSKERDLCRSALELISSPVRPDGTYNRSREACERIAREALNEARK